MTLANRLQGAKAQRAGRGFEEAFARRCSYCALLAYNRVPDGCRTLGARKLIRVKTPYDWVLTFEGQTALLDTKTFDIARLLPSKIESHQMKAMLEHELMGATAGYVIYFRPVEEVRFAPASVLKTIFETGKGCEFTSLLPLGKYPAFDPRRVFASYRAHESKGGEE